MNRDQDEEKRILKQGITFSRAQGLESPALVGTA